MTPAALLAIAFASLVVAHLSSTATKVLQDIAWHELEDYASKDKRRFDVIHDQCEAVETSTETLLYLSITIHLFCGIAWAFTSNLIGFERVTDMFWCVLVETSVLLAAVVWYPRAIADHAGTAFLYHTWSVWQFVSRLLIPLAYGASMAGAMVKRLLGVSVEESEEEALEEEIRAIVAEGQHDGLLDSETRDMIEGVIELDDANVADIMTPRDKMDVMSVELNWNDVLDFVTDVGRTRIPVFNGSQNEFVGILYVKDLFAELRKPESERHSFQEILRNKWNVPMTMHLDELLQQFRQTRNHLALVSDEYNSIAGLVTIEDVLEEIVGEIVDESDKEDLVDIRVINDREAHVVGSAHVENVNEQLGCGIPEDDEFDTIGGFLMHRLGRIPKRGEYVYWNSMRITVLEASRQRAELVRISSVTDAPSDLITGD